jgi:Fe-S cluster biogenesis protein NfuA
MDVKTFLVDETIDIADRLKLLIALISAQLEKADGGTMTYAGFDGETLSIEMGGACVGCPFSKMTMENVVLQTVQQYVPQVRAVQSVSDQPATPSQDA